MSRVVVTGGAGRLGRSVVAELQATGHEVVSVDLATRADLPVDQIPHDLLDVTATGDLLRRLRPDSIVHLAAIAVPFSRPDPEIYAVNTGATMSVLEAAVRSGSARLLVASSPTVHGYGAPGGWLPVRLPLDEDQPMAPWNGYAASKEAMEHIVAMAVRRHGDALRLGVFRPCFVIAPEEWMGAPTQQGHTVAERLAEPGLGAVSLWNYVDARDAGAFVAAWLAGAERIPNGSTFLVGATDALALRPLSELLPRHVPGIGEMAAGLTGTRPAFDSSRARRALGWEARRSWRTELPAHVLATLASDG